MVGIPTSSVYPQKDEAGNRLETEFGLCIYKNCQTVTIQEMPEAAPLGQLPRSVDCYLESDLVDNVKPGDRIVVVGVYRALSHNTKQVASGYFRTMLLTNGLQKTSREAGILEISMGDVQNIRSLGQRPDIFHLLARSLAPSIYGHKYVKQALALLLLGGVEHTLPNHTHIRGDINILMVGDPSTAKSQVRNHMSTQPQQQRASIHSMLVFSAADAPICVEYCTAGTEHDWPRQHRCGFDSRGHHRCGNRGTPLGSGCHGVGRSRCRVH